MSLEATCRGIVLFVAAASALLPQSSDDTRHAIVSDLRSGKYGEARGLLDRALKQSPNDAALWTLNGFALVHLGNRKEALAAYQRAIEISSDYLPALEGAAEIEYEASGQQARALLEKILKIHPDDETSRAMLASLAFRRGDCAAATKEFAQSESVISSKVGALEEYGACLVRLRRTADAIPVFQRLSELQPDDAKARYNLAVVQSLASRYQDVIATLRPSLAKSPQDADSLDLLAEAYEATSDTPQAVAALRQAIIANPDAPGYYLDFANISLAHAAYQVGIDMLNVGLKRLPDAASLYLARGILYIESGHYEQAESDFAEAERIDPNVQFGSSVRGLAELQRNDLPHAEQTIRARLSGKPDDAFLHYLLAETLTRKGAAVGSPEFSEAVQSAERAVQLQPNLALARDLLGRLYMEQGKTRQAIEQSRRAFEEDPTDQTALYHLILALRKGNRAGEIPELTTKLAALREQARAKEAAEHKYALVEANPAKPSAGEPK